MKTENPRFTSIGHIASQVLRRNFSGLVSGTSSRGIYLQPESDLTLYVTDDHFRGPLTLNFRGDREALLSIRPGDIGELEDHEITFSDSNLVIQINNPMIWKPGVPPRLQRTQHTSFPDLVHQTRELSPDHPNLSLLKTVIGSEPLPLPGLPGFPEQVIQLSKTLKTGNPSQIISQMNQILGAGPGLTPVGDDLILGILLTGNRAKKNLHWTGDLIHFYHTLLSAAEEKTTRISWSLLSCAVQGSADERIIRVLDGLIAGREIPTIDLDHLLAWGSSSGMAVLAGILMALA